MSSGAGWRAAQQVSQQLTSPSNTCASQLAQLSKLPPVQMRVSPAPLTHPRAWVPGLVRTGGSIPADGATH